MELEQWIQIAFGLMALMLITGKIYPKNYWLMGFWMLLGSWFFATLITAFEEVGYAFPLILLVFNLIINGFLIQNARNDIG